jgi:hypothetical protein
MKLLAMIPLNLALLIASASAQSSAKPVYVESSRKGSTKISENKFEVKLDTKAPIYRVHLKDARNKDRYVFSIMPARVGEEDKTILAWQASLEDIRHRFYGNLLLSDRDPYLTQGAAGNVMRLDPNPYAAVPLQAQRVIKVEDFYCVIQVTRQHPRSADRWLLDALDVDVQFTNTNPLAVENN